MDVEQPFSFLNETCPVKEEDTVSFGTATEAVSKPILSDYHVFGVGYDVILVSLGWVLAISFTTKTLRELAAMLRAKQKCSGFCAAVLDFQYLVPGVLGAVSSLALKDIIATMMGYSSFEPMAALCMGISAGALSMNINLLVQQHLTRFLPGPRS